MVSRIFDLFHNLLGEKNFNDWKTRSEKWKDSNITLPKKIKTKGGDVSININIYRTEPEISGNSEKILDHQGLFASEDVINIENTMLQENIEDKALLNEFQIYCEPQHYDALRLSMASQKLHESGNDVDSLKIVDTIRRKYGSDGNAIFNLLLSSVLKSVVLSTLNWYKFQIYNVDNVRAKFIPEFKELLKDYDYVIFVGVTKTVGMIVKEMEEKYKHKINYISIYSREKAHNVKVKKALENFQENKNNPRIKIEEFENEYFRITNAQNYKIYFIDRMKPKLSRKARKRYKTAKKKK